MSPVAYPAVSKLMALDVALLLPADVSTRAIRLSASLPRRESRGLTLDADHLPHITLAQLFAFESELPSVCELVGATVRSESRLRVHVDGCRKHDSTLWLAIRSDRAIAELHERVMNALAGVERAGGGPAAFANGDARTADIAWVSGYRQNAAFRAFLPHVTLGHGSREVPVGAFEFEADTVAVCHLGRFCTCRRVLASWSLVAPGLPAEAGSKESGKRLEEGGRDQKDVSPPTTRRSRSR